MSWTSPWVQREACRAGRGWGRQAGGARTATTERGAFTTWMAAVGMVMAVIGMVTAAIGSAVAAMRKAKTALGAVPTETIAAEIAAVLVPIKGNRYIATIYNHLQNAAEA